MVDENKPQFAEDSELERAKSLWKENGRSIIVGLSVGLASVFGYNYWQGYQQEQAESASILFDRLGSSLLLAELKGNPDSETDTDSEAKTDAEKEEEADDESEDANDVTIRNLVTELMDDYKSTPYAVHGAFSFAKFSVERGNFDEAAQALEWVVDNSKATGMRHIARLRLAAVLLAKEGSEEEVKAEADTVLALLEVEESGGFSPRYDELRGDAFLKKGETDSARTAYQNSFDALSPSDDERDLLQLKLDNIGN